MENMKLSINEDTQILTIEVDMTKERGLSKSLKSRIIATSNGNAKIPGTDAIIGLNVYRKA